MVCILPDLLRHVEAVRASGRRIVFTNGVFDILHPGHVRLLQDARAMGDCLVVGVNSDASVRVLKGPLRPIYPDHERAKILAALSPVDFVTIFDEETPFDLISAVRPDILVKGGDYKAGEIVGADVVMRSGGQVNIVPFAPGWSSSGIIERVCALQNRD